MNFSVRDSSNSSAPRSERHITSSSAVLSNPENNTTSAAAFPAESSCFASSSAVFSPSASSSCCVSPNVPEDKFCHCESSEKKLHEHSFSNHRHHDCAIDDDYGYFDEELDEEEEEESRHFANVCRAFQYYSVDAMREVARMERHFRALSAEDEELLDERVEDRISKIQEAVTINQSFIDMLLLHQVDAFNPDADTTNHSDAHGCLAEESSNCSNGSCHGEETSRTSSPSNTLRTASPKTKSSVDQIQPSLDTCGNDHEIDRNSTAANNACSPLHQNNNHGNDGASSSSNEIRSDPSLTGGASPSKTYPLATSGIDQNTNGQEQGDIFTKRLKNKQRHISPLDRANFNSRPSHDHAILVRNMSKVRSTLRQFVRDWSEEGKDERDAAYGPLLSALDEHLPIEDPNNRPRVLCPGSGLGRLPFEVVLKGYACQGNEFSYFMLLGSNFVLNCALAERSCSLVPYCLSTSNRRRCNDHLQCIKIPDVCPSALVPPKSEFSMCAGEFVEVYAQQEGEWDGVLTCYFIDTAKNIILYIKTIAKILREGGLWSNFGPLLYHFAEMPNEMSIELSWEEIEGIIKRYFDLKQVDWRDSYYTTNSKSMMQMQYHCVFFVAIRNKVPVTVNVPPPSKPTKEHR